MDHLFDLGLVICVIYHCNVSLPVGKSPIQGKRDYRPLNIRYLSAPISFYNIKHGLVHIPIKISIFTVWPKVCGQPKPDPEVNNGHPNVCSTQLNWSLFWLMNLPHQSSLFHKHNQNYLIKSVISSLILASDI